MNIATDEINLRNWLEASGQTALSALVGRHALRALPMAGPVLLAMSGPGAPAELQGSAALSILRVCLTGCVSCKHGDRDLSDAASNSRRALEFRSEDFGRYESRLQRSLGKVPGDLPALHPATAALLLAGLAGTAVPSKQDMGKLVNLLNAQRPDPVLAMATCAAADAHEIGVQEQPSDVFNTSLWLNHSMPDELAKNLEKLRSFFQTAPDVWNFWARWYEGFLDGEPVNWQTQLAVAEIPDEDWLKGPAWVSSIIERIEANARTAVAPTLVLDEASSLFRIGKDDFLPEETIRFVTQRISLALQNALTSSSGNGLTDTSYEAVAISTVLENHATDASLLATAFYDASLALSANIGETYPDDPSLVNLKNALYAASEEICELSPEARKRCSRLASLRVSESVQQSEQPDVLKLADVISKETDTAAGEVIKSDAQTIAKGAATPKWIRARFANYVSTVTIWIDKTKKGHSRLSWLIETVDQVFGWFRSEDDAD